MAASSAVLNIKIMADASSAQRGLDGTATKAGRMSAGIQKASAPAALALAGIGAAAISMGKAAAEDAQQQAVLKKALKNTTGATDAQVAAVESHISAMSQATGVADDQLRPAMGNLVRATGDVTKSQDAMGVALDVAAATGQDVEAVSKAMAKGYAGNTKALGKLVPGMDKAVLASGDMDKVMGELARTTGGSAAAAADTAAGKMQIMQTQMGEAKETIGAALLPAMSKFGDILTTVAGLIQRHSTLFLVLAGVIATVAAAILVINAATTIYTAVSAIAGAVSGAAWLAALWPILLVIAAVIAVVAVIVLLWKKCAWFRKAVTAIWEAIKAAFFAVVQWMKTAWQNTINAIVAAIRWVQSVWRAVVTWIRTAWQVVVNAIAVAVRWVVAVFRAAWAGIRAAAAAVVNWLRSAWAGVMASLRAQVNFVRAVVSAAFRAISSVAGTIAGAVKRSWESVFGALKSAARVMGNVVSAPFRAIKSAVDTVINAVKSLVDWLRNIKMPKLSFPKMPSWLGGSSSASRTASASLAPATDLAMASFSSPLAPLASVSSGLGSLSTGLGSMRGPVTIVIQGAVDPEGTARQVRRILNAHDRRMGGVSGLRGGVV